MAQEPINFAAELADARRRIAELEAALEQRDETRSALLFLLEDVTESRRQIEQARREWTTIFDAVQDPIFVHDKAFRIVRANRAYAECAGMDIKEVIGRFYWEVFPKGAGPMPGCAAALKEEQAEAELVLDSGEIFRSRSFVVGDAKRRELYSVHILEDVSEQRAAEQMLRESERYFHQMVDGLPEMIWMSGTDKLCTYFNKQWLGFTGRSLEQELGDGWAEGIHPGDYDRCIETYTSAFDAREAFTMEYRLRRFDAVDRWVLDTGIPRFAPDREFAGYIGSALDITERKRAEEEVHKERDRAQRYLNTAEVIILALDFEGKVTLVNRKGCEILGYREHELLGKNWFANCLPEPFRECAQQLFSRMTSGEIELVESMESQVITRAGDERTVTWHNSLLRDERGEVNGILSSGEDVTEYRQAEQERQELQWQLQRVQKMQAMGQLTGGIAHDFNNILASVMGYTGLALERYVPDREGKLAEYLREVYHAGERARDLVAQLLAFSRGVASKPVALRLEPVVKEAVKLLQSTFPSSIRLRTQIDERLPTVMIDPVQLHQLVMNLCINARDAVAGHGSIDIELHGVRTVDAECASCHGWIKGDFIALVVRDTGGGIEPEVVARMFDPFFTTKEAGEGSGMGLSVVHRIAHERGGHILLATEPGAGAEISLLLPAMPVEPEQLDRQEADWIPAAEQWAGDQHILVVDDEESVARFIGELLESRGYQVTVMTDSRAALARFEADPDAFDLIVTDQTMPGRTGVELARAMLELRHELNIILCSGYSEQVDEARAKALGIRSYVAKPLSAAALLERVRELLGGSQPQGNAVRSEPGATARKTGR